MPEKTHCRALCCGHGMLCGKAPHGPRRCHTRRECVALGPSLLASGAFLRGFLCCPCSLLRLRDGSAATSLLSRPAQASACTAAHQKWALSGGQLARSPTSSKPGQHWEHLRGPVPARQLARRLPRGRQPSYPCGGGNRDTTATVRSSSPGHRSRRVQPLVRRSEQRLLAAGAVRK